MKTGLATAIALPLALASPAVRADDEAPLGERLVDVMNQLFASTPASCDARQGRRGRGQLHLERRRRKAQQGRAVPGRSDPVTARFSDATGLPAIPDGDPNANPHGLGLRFHLADGGDMDVVTNSLKFFPVATGEEFLGLLQAVAASGPDAPKPTPLEQFVEAHPTVPQAFASTPTPASYARETYNGVNAFVLVDATGMRHPFRFRLAPVAGEAHLSAEDAAKRAQDFLADELRTELAQGPVRFRLLAQLAQPGDPTADPSKAWPDDRELVDLADIALTRPADDNVAAEKELLLLPGSLSDEIEPSDDPMIDVLNEAYAVSFGRRSE